MPLPEVAWWPGAATGVALPVGIASAAGPSATGSRREADDVSWCAHCGRPDVDPLTGLPDRWRWARDAAALLDGLDPGSPPVALVVLDLDRFKVINDSAGHVVGDAALAAVAAALRSVTRPGDLWGRYGSHTGDEFVGLLPNADRSSATAVAERARRRVAAIRLPDLAPLRRHGIARLATSVGLAIHRPGHDLAATFRRADAALLKAKRSGRDRVCSDVDRRAAQWGRRIPGGRAHDGVPGR